MGSLEMRVTQREDSQVAASGSSWRSASTANEPACNSPQQGSCERAGAKNYEHIGYYMQLPVCNYNYATIIVLLSLCYYVGDIQGYHKQLSRHATSRSVLSRGSHKQEKVLLSSAHANQMTNLRPWFRHENSKPEFSKTEKKCAKMNLTMTPIVWWWWWQ